ncbi:MAG: NADH-quinone oxidoreductase subunit NuoN [Geobacter sp.]|nr:NADH-quinone oxidoreductase subunit NuoN [Geobacter sp.]
MTTADLWSLMPLLILAAGALLVLLLGALVPGRYPSVIAAVTAAGVACWMVMAPPLASLPGLGIALTPFARLFSALFGLTAVGALLLSLRYNDRQGIVGEEYPATLLFSLFGMVALSMATNLLVLFLGLESLTFGFYFLVACDRSRAASAEAGLKYLLSGAVAAAFTAFGLALIYAGTGTLLIAPAMQAALSSANPTAAAGAGLLLLGVAFKVSLVPAHLWTPDVYQGAPTPVTAFLATASKGAALAALLLLFSGSAGSGSLHGPLWCLSLFSMLLGNLAALRQAGLKRLIAYSSIAQMGYVALALTSGSGGHGAVAFYAVAYSAMNLAAFGALAALADQGGDRLEELRGVGYQRPFPAAILALSMFSLAGIPPTAGFMGKFLIFAAALKGGEIALSVIGILTAAVSAYYYLRVVTTLYLRPAEPSSPAPGDGMTAAEYGVLGCAGLLIIVLGIFPSPLLELIDAALR